MKEVKKPVYKKWWIWLIAFFAILVIYGAATGINQAKEDIEKEDPAEVQASESEEEETVTKESDPEMIKKYVDAFNTFQEELEDEYAARIETNNIDNWGPFFKVFSDRVNASREEIQDADVDDLDGGDKFELGTAHTNLIMLATEYGKAISGEADEDKIDYFKGEIELSMNEYK